VKTLTGNPMFVFLLVLTVASFAGLQGWRTLLNNFAVEAAGISGAQMGVIQSVREIPGFLALLVVYLLFVVSEHRLAALSILVLGLGIGLTGWLPSFAGLVFTTLLMSFGFHYYETVNQSLTLQYFDRATAPLVLGRLRGVGAATNIAVAGIFFLVAPWLEFTVLFTGLALAVCAAGVWAVTRDPSDKDLPVQTRRMVFRRKYWLYYVLTFLAGARRQVFVAFAVFLLVEKFGFSLREVAGLFVINNLINTMANPLIGKAIARFGERRVLSLEYAVLLVVFFTYAFAGNRWLVAGMYVVDHLVFNFAMAVRTYFQKIGDPGDIAPSMAVGFTINHVAAVVVPVLGGAAWLLDYRAVFLGGMALALCSLVMVQFMRPPGPEPDRAGS
jgi:hypothetical protein